MDEIAEQEGGASVARLLLEEYDRDTESWSVEKASELWDALASAHAQGRRGRGVRVAVVDSGFDLEVPALARQQVAMAPEEDAPTEHGTVVALLVLEAAPEAELHLYAASRNGKLATDRVVAAVDACVEQGVDVVNLSLGAGVSAEKTSVLGTDGPSPADPRLDVDDWRTLHRVPIGPLWEAVERAVAAGVTVVVSAGNAAGYVYVPAAVPGVASVGFHTVVRELADDGGMEEAASGAPTFSQSAGVDLLVVQPRHVLGSSFACPLVTGLVALMADRRELPDFLRVVRRSANASGMLPLLLHGPPASRDDVLVADSLFKGALSSSPHQHWLEDRIDAPCPECAVFALAAYVDFGLFTLFTGNAAVAVRLLMTARALAPRNAQAAGNLAVALARRAEELRTDGHPEMLVDVLTQARDHARDAVALRPGYAPFAARLAELEGALLDPDRWEMAP